MNPHIIHLTPPNVSVEHIKEKITCIRAHRERIFNVSTQLQAGKLICHNYGQGGAGWTFLFGCVAESLRQYEQQLALNPEFKNKPITIIGAGCYGLLTAIELTRKGYQVQIVAKDSTTIPSYKAAGFFFPRPRKSSTPAERAIFEATGIESYQTYLSIIASTHPFIQQGPQLVPGYYGHAIDPGFAPYIARGLIAKPKNVTIDFGNGKQYAAMRYETVFINATIIMQELQRCVAELAIPIHQQEIDSFEQITDPIIFNCAGLGAKKLSGDARVVPVQGHLITLKNQPTHLNYMLNFKVVALSPRGTPRDELIYFAPKEDGILGITFIRGCDSLTANEHEFERLLQRCQDFFGFI